MRLDFGLPKPLVPVFWGMLFLEATFGTYLSIWPLWIERLGAPIAVVGLVLGSTGFIRLAVILPSASIARRFGYRKSILVCRAAAAIGLMSAALATHWTQLFIMIVFAAAGELAFPLLQSLVAIQGGEQRMRSFALVFTVGPSASLIAAPLVSGALVAIWGMRAAFVLASLCTTTSIFFLTRIEEPAAQHQSTTAGEGYRAAFRTSGVRLVVVLLSATVFALSLGASFVPTFLEDVRGRDAAQIATISAASAVGSAVFGVAVARVRRLQHAPISGVAFTIIAMVVAFTLFRSALLIELLVLGYFFRGGFFSSWAMLQASLSDLTPAKNRAHAFAICEMASGIANAVGPMVGGVLYARGASLPIDVAIALCLMLVPAMLIGQRRAHHIREVVAASGDESAIPEPMAA